MADSCCHCRSADVMHGFDTFQCLTCGKITSLDGRPLLPDSMVFEPNHDASTAQFGWPFADQQATIDRGAKVCATQWGTPIQPVQGDTVSDTDPQPEPEAEPTPEPEPEVTAVPEPEAPADPVPAEPEVAPAPQEVPA